MEREINNAINLCSNNIKGHLLDVEKDIFNLMKFMNDYVLIKKLKIYIKIVLVVFKCCKVNFFLTLLN